MALTEKLTAIADAIRVQSGKTGKLTLDQMPSEIVDLQSLGFEVVGGTSAPSSPKANTIWVNTDTPITGWGIGDYHQYPGWSMPEGYVYIDADTSTNTGGDFNALKKNEIWLRPIRAIQRVNGAWVDKTAKSYQNGAWVDWWNGHLYEYGNLYEQYTGGWTYEGYKAKGYTTINPPQFNSDHIYVTGKNNYGPGAVGTVNKIDLSGHTKVCILADINYNDTAQLSVVTNKSDDLINSPSATVKLPQGTAKTVTLDITTITEGYIAVYATSPIYVYDIWLE